MSALVCTMDAEGNSSCGTGGWVGPRPGDPNTANILITATPAFGGIDVNWTYPDINPEAVAYTKLFRSLLPNANTAPLHRAAVQGSFFYDQINNDSSTVYYYWIQVVSVYGTVSDMIGPAWATAKPRIEHMIEDLTGKIDAGVLAQALKADIARIELNHLAITQEMLDRDEADDALGVYVNQIEAHSGETRALLQQEVLARVDQGEAFVSTVNTVYAELNENIAAVQTEVTALVTTVGALAQEVTRVEAEFGDNLAQVEQSLSTSIQTVNGKVVEIGALYTVKVNVNGLAGGFGIYNNGQEVEAGFDVDRFWIGRTSANKRKPFIIDGGIVYIDEAAINKLTFSKLRDEAGAFIVTGGKVKAAYIQADQLEVEYAKIKNIDVQTGHIRNLAVDTLKIKGNAVTIPVGMEGWGSVPTAVVTLDQPGLVSVMVMANFIAADGNTGPASCFLSAVVNGVPGPQVGVTATQDSSTSAVAFGTFWLPAGTHNCSGAISFAFATRVVQSTSIFAMGIKR